jgi:hypothetical protein
LGDLHLWGGKLQEALENYQAVDCHIKAKKCFNLQITKDPDNYLFYKQKGDYFAKKAMFEAIDCYHDALGLTMDPKVHEEINNTICNLLSNNQS